MKNEKNASYSSFRLHPSSFLFFPRDSTSRHQAVYAEQFSQLCLDAEAALEA